MLILSRKPGESVIIGNSILIFTDYKTVHHLATKTPRHNMKRQISYQSKKGQNSY